jgi:hypothetical protein
MAVACAAQQRLARNDARTIRLGVAERAVTRWINPYLRIPETTTPPDEQGGVVSKPSMRTASALDQNVMLQLLM